MNSILVLLMALSVLIVSCARSGNNKKQTSADSNSEKLTVRSADGTYIGFSRVGSGSIPIVIVHGALNSGDQWMEVAESLSEICTCYVMDRWGRGDSEHHKEYSLERESEDIRAVLAEAGPEAYLMAHSSGAIYALEAALRSQVAGLILYEPPLHAFIEERFKDRIMSRIRDAAKEKQFEKALSIFLTAEAGVPDSEISQFRGTAVWDHMLSLTPQSVQEWEILSEAGLTIDRYKSIETPTLLMAGTETEEHPSFATAALHQILGDARTVMLEDQGHSAHREDPGMIAEKVEQFISGMDTWSH